MGAGNWSVRNRFFNTTTLQLDDVLESFEQYRERALEDFKGAVKYSHPEADVSNLSLDDASEPAFDEIREDALEAYAFLDNESEFIRDQYTERYDELKAGLTMAAGAVTKPKADMSSLVGSLKHAKFKEDTSALVVGAGAYAQVVLREWQQYLYIGIAPSNLLDEYDALVAGDEFNASVDRLFGRCLAAMHLDNPAFDMYRGVSYGPIPVELRSTETGLANVDSTVLEVVINRAVALAQEIDELDAADPRAAGMKQAFVRGFGCEPVSVLLVQDTIDAYLEFLDQAKVTPGAALAGYNHELAQLEHSILDYLASLEEDVHSPSGAWTSKKVDLSNFRHAAAIQLDAAGLAKVRAGDVLGALGSAKPSQVTLMRESQYDRTVAGAVQLTFPVTTEVSGPMYTLHERAAAAVTPRCEESAAMVWRGHLSWGHFDNFATRQTQWLNEAGEAKLGDLPQWMALVTDSQEIRNALEVCGAPAELAKTFYTESGELDITGVLAEVHDGEFGSFYVSRSSKPYATEATYEAVLLNGQYRTVDAPTPSAEVTHG